MVGVEPLPDDPQRPAKIKAAFDHEVAHLLDYLLNLHNEPEVIALWNDYAVNRKTLGLAEIGIKEFIANGWTEYHNNPPREGLPKQLSSLIIKKYRLLYGQK